MVRVPTLRPVIGKMNGRSLPDAPKQPEAWYRDARYNLWAKQVKERAGYQCERCGELGRYADHITELKDGGQAYDVSNGQCLCASCHTNKTINQRAARAFNR